MLNLDPNPPLWPLLLLPVSVFGIAWLAEVIGGWL